MKNVRKNGVALLLFIGSCLLTLILFYCDAFQRVEYIAFDRVTKNVRSEKKIAPKVVVILIDEASLDALQNEVGRWPWPRAIYSDLLEFLMMGEPEAILFDILFTEIQEPRVNGKLSPNDEALTLATRESGNVYHAIQLVREDRSEHLEGGFKFQEMPRPFKEKFALKKVQGELKGFSKGDSYYIPFPELQEAASGIAVVEFSADQDGIYRRSSPLREFQGAVFPVLGLAPFVKDTSIITVEKNQITVGGKRIPLDHSGSAIINSYGRIEPFSISGIFASLQKIREGDVESILIDPEVFRDKIIYVGSSAVGVEDLKATTLSPLTPGVFLHASLASNFILNDFLQPVPFSVSAFLILLYALLSIFSILYLDRFVWKVGVPVFCLLGWIALYFYGIQENFVFEFVPPAFSIFCSSIAAFVFLVSTESRDKQRVKRMFSQYVSPEVLKKMTDDFGEYVATGAGEKVELTILFTDIRGFTSLSDTLDPASIVKMLNVYLSEMCDEILSRQGTVDKFIGDSIMAFWGAPIKIHNHAELAVRSALGLVRKIAIVNDELQKMGFNFEIKQGIGISTGDAILGNIGSAKKLNYTVIGDTVNTASRMETLNKRYSVPIIISEYTYEQVKDVLPCRIIEKTAVRGKSKQLSVYEAFSFTDEHSLQSAWEICKKTNLAYSFFESGDFEKAYSLYQGIEKSPLTDLFMEKCREGNAHGGLEQDRRARK